MKWTVPVFQNPDLTRFGQIPLDGIPAPRRWKAKERRRAFELELEVSKARSKQ